ELAKRYFRSHGPATVRDFVWWSGLTTADAKRGLSIMRGRQEVIDGLSYWRTQHSSADESPQASSVHLLPIYDEYLGAYRDLHAVPRKAGGSGRLEQAVVVAGQVVGTWKFVAKSSTVVIEGTSPRQLTRSTQRAVREAAERYGRFLRLDISVNVRSTRT